MVDIPNRAQAKIDISAALPALTIALQDPAET
jgi:hypothetical protein